MDIPMIAYLLVFYRQRVKSQRCGREWEHCHWFYWCQNFAQNTNTSSGSEFSSINSDIVFCASAVTLHGVQEHFKINSGLGLQSTARRSNLWIHLTELDRVFGLCPLHRHTSSLTHNFVGTPVVTQVGNFVHLANPGLWGKLSINFVPPCRSKLRQVLHITSWSC